jgi:hypothetical protein
VASAQVQDPVEVSRDMGALPIGAPLELVRKNLKDAIAAEMKPVIQAEREAVARDRLKRELPERQRAIDEAYVTLDSSSGFDVSILSGEFRAGEGLLKLSRGAQERYHLFSGGKLWKVIETVAPHYDFAGAALRMCLEYGKPYKVEFDAGNPAKPPVRVQWLRGERIVELADRRGDYGCYTVLAADKAPFEERAQDRVAASSGKRVNPLVQDAMEQQPGGEVDDIVDKLLKK